VFARDRSLASIEMRKVAIRISALLLAAMFVASCLAAFRSPTPDIPKGWVKIDLGRFSFYAPPDTRNQNVRGIDSVVWQFRNRNMTLNLDYGMYSNDLEPYGDETETERHTEWVRIDGKSAKIVTLRKDSTNPGDKDPKYVAGVYFPEANGPKTKLTFWVDCVDVPTRDSAKNIFLSIRFK
jgi:hypothetical protein